MAAAVVSPALACRGFLPHNIHVNTVKTPSKQFAVLTIAHCRVGQTRKESFTPSSHTAQSPMTSDQPRRTHKKNLDFRFQLHEFAIPTCLGTSTIVGGAVREQMTAARECGESVRTMSRLSEVEEGGRKTACKAV